MKLACLVMWTVCFFMPLVLFGCNKSSPENKKVMKEVNLFRVECMMSHSGGVDVYTRATDVEVSRDGTVISLPDGSVTKYSPHVSCKVMKQAEEKV